MNAGQALRELKHKAHREIKHTDQLSEIVKTWPQAHRGTSFIDGQKAAFKSMIIYIESLENLLEIQKGETR